MEIFCVKQRCHLCKFRLHDDENIVADGKGASYARCSGECQHSDRDGEARAYHVACVEGMASSSVLYVMEASAFAYEALLPELEARKSRLRSLSESCLHRAFPQLPAEICASIAELCLRRMAVAHNWRRVSMPSEKSRLTILFNIWARFMKLEGVAYISSLRNSPDDRHNLLIFALDPASPIKKIYLAEDYLGGLKVRRIVSDDEAAADKNGSASILWAAPRPRIPRLIQLEKSHPPARMATFVCNDPGVIAYSFKTSHDRVVVFGQHGTIKSKTRLFLMDRPCQEKPGRIFFEESNSGVRAMAFESPRPRVSPDHTVDLPQPTRNLVKPTAPVSWFYSTACLRGIKEAVPSQRCKPGWRKVIVLPRYYDGRRACLGQVRLDSLMAPVEVGEHPSSLAQNLRGHCQVSICYGREVVQWWSLRTSSVFGGEDKD
ncbi:hypothetical protein CPLU01_05419 [Colletotrichum plurivorum]|uniref:Uncharacterized protein n=1 Tax=Colletotrichum plurivorum TaxID=2175906 RepID=A0A8H6KLZ0_9PEZI|nr:hypothetical protein CPLU01_05419 [Colletotrichum plurivorum]